MRLLSIWIFQTMVCKLFGITQSSCVFFSSFSILLIAVDRYLFIVHPSARQISTAQVIKFQSSEICKNSFNRHMFSLLYVSYFLYFFLLLFPMWWGLRLTTASSQGRHTLTVLRGGSLDKVGWSTQQLALSSSTWYLPLLLDCSTPGKWILIN